MQKLQASYEYHVCGDFGVGAFISCVVIASCGFCIRNLSRIIRDVPDTYICCAASNGVHSLHSSASNCVQCTAGQRMSIRGTDIRRTQISVDSGVRAPSRVISGQRGSESYGQCSWRGGCMAQAVRTCLSKRDVLVYALWARIRSLEWLRWARNDESAACALVRRNRSTGSALGGGQVWHRVGKV